MIRNPTLGHHAPPVRDICIVSESQGARVGYSGRQQGLGPRSRGCGTPPCLLAVAGEAVDENDASDRLLAN